MRDANRVLERRGCRNTLMMSVCFRYASEALQLAPEDPECHKWYAIAVGSLSEFVGVQQKIQNGYEFKKHVDSAIKLKPGDPTLHHMLGRWCYEASSSFR